MTRENMRCALRYLIISLTFYTARAEALTCKTLVHLVVRCQNDVCTESFFAPRRMAGDWCKTILNVQDDEPVQKFDGQLGFLKKSDSEKYDGYYAIEAYDQFNPYDRNMENLRCFKRNENGDISLTCHDKFTKIEKLEFPPNQEIRSVIGEMASQSKREKALNWILHLILPLAILLLMIGAVKFHKTHGNKLAIGILFVSLVGLSQSLWGRASWSLAGLIGVLFCLTWLSIKLIFKFKTRRKMSERSEN